MGLNDAEVLRNLKVTNLLATAGEQSVDLRTAALSGRAPLHVMVQNIEAANAAEVGFVSGGVMVVCKVQDTTDLGAVMPGDRFTLFYRSGAGANLRLLVWS